MPGLVIQAIGRVVLLRWKDIMSGDAPLPDDIVRYAKSRKARYLLLDTTDAPFADSDGLRWLIKLREQSLPIRIAARPGGKIWKALKIFGLDNEMYGTVKGAWRSPWGVYTLTPAPKSRTRATPRATAV